MVFLFTLTICQNCILKTILCNCDIKNETFWIFLSYECDNLNILRNNILFFWLYYWLRLVVWYLYQMMKNQRSSPQYSEKNKIQTIIGYGFRPKTQWLLGQKFYKFCLYTLNMGKMKCHDAACEVSEWSSAGGLWHAWWWNTEYH
jgi:hypothetical protein